MTTISQAISRIIRPRFAAVSVACVVLMLGIGGSQRAFGQERGPSRQGGGPFREAFYPPRLVMRYQTEIDLTKAQRDSIRSVSGRVRSRYHRLKSELPREMQALRRLIREQRVDLDSVQVQLGRVLSIENQVKRTRLRLMARVKNMLTPEQQAALDTLRANRRKRSPQ